MTPRKGSIGTESTIQYRARLADKAKLIELLILSVKYEGAKWLLTGFNQTVNT